VEQFDAAAAEYDQAMDLIVGLQYPFAHMKLEKAYEQFCRLGAEEYMAKSLFWLGYCSEQLGEFVQARQRYQELIMRFPHSREANRAETALDEMD
jgi:TolA-binding protein